MLLETRGPHLKTDRQAPPFSGQEESSVYRSVGKKRPPFSLGKGKGSCLSPLPLEKMEEGMR